MFTTGAKYFFGITAAALLAAVVYAMATYGHGLNLNAFLGAISLGYKGGVGDHLGYSILVGLAGASGFLGCVTVAVRDADPKAVAEVAAAGADVSDEAVPEARAPLGASYWPVLTGAGVAIVVLGLVLDEKLFIIGWIVLAVAAIEWSVRAWAERATGDPRVNRTIRNRFLNPVELPIFALCAIVLFVFSLSRLLLSVGEHASAVIFAGVPAVVLLVAALVSVRPTVAKAVLGGLLALFAAVIISAGVVGLTRGQREFERKGEHGNHFVPHVVGSRGLGPPGVTVTGLPRGEEG